MVKSSVGIAIVTFAGLAATAVGVVRRVQRLHQEIDPKFDRQVESSDRHFDINLDPDQEMNVVYLKKPTPIFYLHQT